MTSIAFDEAVKLYSVSVDSSVLPPVVLIVEVNVVLGGCIAPTTGWITSNNIFLVAVTDEPPISPEALAVSEFAAVTV